MWCALNVTTFKMHERHVHTETYINQPALITHTCTSSNCPLNDTTVFSIHVYDEAMRNTDEPLLKYNNKLLIIANPPLIVWEINCISTISTHSSSVNRIMRISNMSTPHVAHFIPGRLITAFIRYNLLWCFFSPTTPGRTGK